MAEIRTRAEEREYLLKLISDWNASRLDIFAINEPTEDLEYRGVMRFFFQDSGSKVATKCVRISSKDNTDDVTKLLVEKFHPDMKMLSNPSYSLYEVHPNGEAHKLKGINYPLQIQLEWQVNDREGRFLLKSDQAKIVHSNLFDGESNQNLKRRLSKREKKQLKKKREQEAKKGNKVDKTGKDDTAIAQHLYDELPETSFTRSISNPEAVMRRRRQQKLEKKLKEFESKDSPPGGTLKIFAETLKPEIPYKTLLVSVDDATAHVVKEALMKYNMEKEDPEEYCLVMVNIPPEGTNTSATLGKERVVHDEDCPLRIAVTWPENRGTVVFHLRRRANLPKYRRDKRRSKSPTRQSLDVSPDKSVAERLAQSSYPQHLLPYLLELSPDGDELDHRPKLHRLQMNVTDVGSEKLMSSGGDHLQLFAPHILPRHCVITNMDGRVSVTPSSGDAEVFVDGKRIYETTTLRHGDVVKIGRLHTFRFCDPAYEEKSKRHSAPSGDTGSISSTSDIETQRKHRPRSTGSTMQSRHDSHSSYNMEDTIDVDTSGQTAGMFETTFDVSGEVKTVGGPEYNETQPHSPYTYDRLPPSPGPQDTISDKLPATLEFRETGEDAFFAAVISEVNGLAVHFKLAPTYTLYMCSRYRMSQAYRPELVQQQRGERLGVTILKIANMARSTIRENSQMPGSLAFWMANCSELLHFVKQDIDISPYTKDSQQVLAQSVQLAFRHLVLCVQHGLRNSMPAFLDQTDHADMEDSDRESLNDSDHSEPLNSLSDGRSFRVPGRFGPDGQPLSNGDSWLVAGRRSYGRATVSEVLYNLSSTMSLLRRCRVNAALTIQVFSQLFHFINMWLFNKLVLEPKLGLCTRDWGRRLDKRLARVEKWALKQGLELAADCHLGRIQQAAALLQAPKNSSANINAISSSCFKLNSLQMRNLLENYRPAHDEYIPQELIDHVVSVAEGTADQTAYNNGQEIQLEEDPDLQLPFLLPEDGYSCEVIRGLPQGLREFLEPLAATGLCSLTIQPASSGLWTVYQKKYKEMGVDQPNSFQPYQGPEIMEVSFNKGSGGMGLSIVAAKGVGQDKLGIYIKQVVKNGPAARDERLEAGDQLLYVNGESLIGVTQEKAAEFMVKSGANVTLRIVKQGAIFHGLATLLNQQTLVPIREPPRKLTPLEPEPEPMQTSPTVPDEDLQRPPTRWLPDNSLNYNREPSKQRTEEDRMRYEEEERRRHEEEERRRHEEEERRRNEEEEEKERRQYEVSRREEEEQRHLEEERQKEAMRRHQEDDRLAREEERKRRESEEEQRLRQQEEKIRMRMEEERRIIEKERRQLAEERRLLEEERRKEEERKRTEEQRRLEEERKLAEEQRRIEEERKIIFEQRKMEEEWRLAEGQRIRDEAERRRSQEEGNLEEQRRRAEEERRIEEEEHQYAEEHRRLEEKKRVEEQRRREDQRRLAEEERRRGEEIIKPIENQQRRQRKIRFEDEIMQAKEPPKLAHRPKVEEPEVAPVVRERQDEQYEEPVIVRGRLSEDQKSSIDAIFAELENETTPERPRSLDYSNKQLTKDEETPDEPPKSSICVDSRNTPFGRAIVVKQGMLQQLHSPTSPSNTNSQNFDYERVTRNLKDIDHQERERRERKQQHEQEEFDRWQRRQSEIAEQREREVREKHEKDLREQEERQQRERAERERGERESAERERAQRERAEREYRERQEQEYLDRLERERQEMLERQKREREEREREEEERIMNQMQQEERAEQQALELKKKQQEEHRQQLEEEQNKLRVMERERMTNHPANPTSKQTSNYIENMSADEVEKEFQRRLELDKKRRQYDDGYVDERRAGGLVSVTRVTYHHPDREEQLERDRKLQLIIQEREQWDRERKEAEYRKRMSEDSEDKERQQRHQHRLQVLEQEREQQKETQKRLRELSEQEQGDWLRNQKERREQLKLEQQRARPEKKTQEEDDVSRKRQELKQKREQDDSIRQMYQRQREQEEKRIAEEQNQERLHHEREIQKKLEEQVILKEKEEEARRQLQDEQRLRNSQGSIGEPDHVIELKERALADYERRRKLIDQEINRRKDENRALVLRHQKEMEDAKVELEQLRPVSALRNSNTNKPKKQVSFSNVATEICEPSSPTYIVGTSSGYTAKVTPAASVRLVNTRMPDDSESPPVPRPPPPVDDEDDLPPPPPPPPPEELLREEHGPPPLPLKSNQSVERSALSDRSSSSSSINSRVTLSSSSSSDPRSPINPTARDYEEVFPSNSYSPSQSNGVQLRNHPISTGSGYGTYPRMGRPMSYPMPADLDDLQIPDSMKYGGSNDNVTTLHSITGLRESHSLGRLGTTYESSPVDFIRTRLARVSLTDEEKSRKGPPPVAKKPENLGFRDKMKLFNQDGTPKDKAKASKWQRENLTVNGDMAPP